MKKRIIVIVSIILAVLIAALSLGLTLSKCSGKKIVQVVMVDNEKDKNNSDTDDSNDDTDDSDDDDDDDSFDGGNGFINDEIGTDLGYTSDKKYDLAELMGVATGDAYMLYSENTEPICDTFHGFTGTVYWPTEWMEGDEVNGRYYTEEMRKAELERLRDAGFTRIRLYIYSTWMYTGDEQNPWDWECERMQNVYEAIREIKSYGIEPMVVIGSSMAKAIYGGDDYTPDCYYLYPRLLDENGEPILMFKWGQYFEQINYELQWKRYGEFAVGLVSALKNHGVPIENYILFTEPHTDGGTPTGAHWEQHIGCFRAIDKALKEAGLRDEVKLMGPNQGNTLGNPGLAKIIHQEIPGVIDMYSSHYGFLGQTSTDDMYDVNLKLYKGYMEFIHDYEIANEFWVDEFHACGDEYLAGDEGDYFLGTSNVNMMVAMMNAGISGFNAWQVIDQVWPFYYGSGGAFLNGAQVIGSARSLYENERPYPSWYAMTLVSRYMSGADHGKSYYTYAEDEVCGLHAATVELPEGGWAVVVVNMSTEDRTFQMNFEKDLNTTLYRYMYKPGMELTVRAKVITADKGFKNVKGELTDTLAGGAVAVYSTRQNFN